MNVSEKLLAVLRRHPEVQVAFLFGSMARGSEHRDSDLDVGIASTAPMSPDQKLLLSDDLAVEFGRPVDLVDLTTASPPVLRQAIMGIRVLKRDTGVYAALLRKLWYDDADIMPNYNMILRTRRERFTIG